MSGDDFVHLHVHSEFSLLDGLANVNDLVTMAAQLGQPALALTDHGVMHGVIPFHRAAKAAGIRPIVGMEAYITAPGRPMSGRDPELDKDNYHLLLLAADQTGYKNLIKLASFAQTEGYYYKPRVDFDCLARHADGLITTTGCLAATVPALLSDENGPPDEKKALEWFRRFRDLFGRDRFFVELQEHNIPHLRRVNRTLIEWAKRHDVRLVVTNDVHYVRAADADAHDTLLCVQTGALKSAEKRLRYADPSYYLKSRAELEAAFRPYFDLPAEAFTNSLFIAEMCDVDVEDSRFHLPDIAIPPGHTYESFLRHLTYEGLRERYGPRANDPVVVERAEKELKIIHDMGFDVYFIIVWDLCRAMKERNIWWNVRGSGAGSIVAYAIGITLIDPLEHDLIFERFLNPGRVSMPDFDLDIPDDSRETMIRYTIEKYGADHVAQIVAFGRMKARAAVHDVGRAFEMSPAEVNRLAQLIPAIPGKNITLASCLDPESEFYSAELKQLYERDERVRRVIDAAMQLEGTARHASTHAAAVIITDQPLTELVPVMRPQKAVVTDTVVQYEFPICESIGLLKVDFLGLATLSIMREAARLIKERHGIEYTLQNIPADDPEAYRLLSSGEVTGIFQVESPGMRRILTEMRPTRFQHIMAVVSLYRPGPMEYIPNFIRRMHGQEEVRYHHPLLEPILAETYGIIVYQEQIMRVATDLAGYTASEADFMRKAVAKKKEKDLLKHRSQMVKGALERGIDEATINQIFDDIEAFARYGFPKAHGADYALITVQTAFLKAHYPLEYMAALLLVEREKTEKVVNTINECRRMGIQVLPPDINESGMDFTLQQLPPDAPPAERDPQLRYPFPVPPRAAIRYGLGAIKNVGEGAIAEILRARAEGGPFTSLEDFCRRVDLRLLNKRVLECLIKVGAFDALCDRAKALAVLDRMMTLSSRVWEARTIGQASLFDLADLSVEQPIVDSLFDPPPDVQPVSPKQKLDWEKELLGVYVSDHPLRRVTADYRRVVTCLCSELTPALKGKTVTLAGMIAGVRRLQTKNGEPMAFLTLEDLQGKCDVTVFPRVLQATPAELLQEGAVVLVRGKVDVRNDRAGVVAEQIADSFEYAAPAHETATVPDFAYPPAAALWEMAEPSYMAGEADEEPWAEGPPPEWSIEGLTDEARNGRASTAPRGPEPPTAPRLLRIRFERRHNGEDDSRRLTEVVQILRRYTGRDRFVIRLGDEFECAFPNDTTGYCPALVTDLERLLGAGCVAVEEAVTVPV